MRLTNDMRSMITRQAVIGILQKRRDAHKKENNSLAALVYDHLYPTDIQTQMNKLPDEFFSQTSQIYIQSGESGYCRDMVELILASSKKISAIDRYNSYRPLFKIHGIDNAVTQRIHKFIASTKKLELDESNLRQKIRTMLNGIQTMKRLAEEWPDGSKYYQDLLPTTPTKNVPAVRGEDITKFIATIQED